ncbi:MAG TPA: hypothetical protein VMY18_14670 [Acidobacteriota bacterium]|nr:hypothetical protein [Acidobacteriota bacterium]
MNGIQCIKRDGFKVGGGTLPGMFVLFVLFVLLATNSVWAISSGQTGDCDRSLSSTVWVDPEGNPLPFETPEEIEAFLQTARVVEMKKIPVGITKPRKMLLEKDGLRMHAIFRYVEDFKRRWDSPKGPKLDFYDNCMYEYAAYRFSRILGLDRVPPVVVRKFKKEDFVEKKLFSKLSKRDGTLQAWVENAMTERDRRARKIMPPNVVSWSRQFQLMHIFDNLISNDDRTQENLLIGPDWKVWFIDSTRAFRPYRNLSGPEDIKRCDRRLWKVLQQLDEETVRQELEGSLSPRLIKCLLKRVDCLVTHLQGLIEERGEHLVIVNAEI